MIVKLSRTHRLQFASDKTAVVIGKPSKDYFLTALESMQIKPEEVNRRSDISSYDCS